MAQQSYKVTAPKGVTGFNGRKYAFGDIVESEPDAHVKAWLRFGQVEKVQEKAPKTKPAEKAPAAKDEKGGKTEEAAS